MKVNNGYIQKDKNVNNLIIEKQCFHFGFLEFKYIGFQKNQPDFTTELLGNIEAFQWLY